MHQNDEIEKSLHTFSTRPSHHLSVSRRHCPLYSYTPHGQPVVVNMAVLAHFSIRHQNRSQNTTFSTRNHIPVWKSNNPPSFPLPRTKTSHKPVPSAQNPPFLRVGDQRKRSGGKTRDEEGSNNFQVSTKVPLFASGRRRKTLRADEGRRWKECKLGEDCFSVV
jgi:hypothetical protein